MEKREDLIEALTTCQERFHIALKAAQICVFEVDLTHQRYTFFENAEAIYGKSGAQILSEVHAFSALPPEEYQASVSAYFAHPDDQLPIARAFHSVLQGNPASYYARMRAGDTEYVWCKVDVVPIIEEGIPARMIGVVSQMDQMLRQVETYRIQAEQDALTGLWNRQGTEARITSLLADASWVLLLIDLDCFKQINDTRGHLSGDDILQRFAQALRHVFAGAPVIGRWGGDEFIVLLPQSAGGTPPTTMLNHLLREAFQACGVTVSIGAALCPQQGTSFLSLFRLADQALYQAKGLKNTYRIYDAGDFLRHPVN